MPDTNEDFDDYREWRDPSPRAETGVTTGKHLSPLYKPLRCFDQTTLVLSPNHLSACPSSRRQAPFFPQGTARPPWEKVPSSLGEKHILFGMTAFSRRGDSPRPSRTPDAGAGAAHSSRHLKRSKDFPCSFRSAAPHRFAPATQAPENPAHPPPSESSLHHGASPPRGT